MSAAAAHSDRQRSAARGRPIASQASTQPSQPPPAKTQPVAASAGVSAQPSGGPPEPAVQHQRPAAPTAVTPLTADDLAETPASRVVQPAAARPTSAAAALRPKPTTLSAPQPAGHGWPTASSSQLRPSVAGAAEQGMLSGGSAKRKGADSIAAATFPVTPSPAAGRLSGGQQRAGISPLPVVQTAKTVVHLAKPAVARAPDMSNGAAKLAVTASAAAIHLAGATATAASKPETAAGTSTAAPEAPRKWHPPPKVQAALVSDGKSRPGTGTNNKAAEPATAYCAATFVPQQTAANGEAGTSRPARSNVKKRQLPAKLAAMTAAAAPAARLADPKAAQSAAVVPASAVPSVSQPQSAVKPALGMAAGVQQKTQPATQQRPQSGPVQARLKSSGKSSPVRKAETRGGSPAVNALKVRSTSLKVRPESGLGSKRPTGSASRAASAELHPVGRSGPGSPAAAHAAPGKAATPARAPSGSSPSAMQPSSGARPLSAQQQPTKPPLRTIVPASPEWGKAPTTAMRPPERKTQVGGHTARPTPTLLANLQSLVKAAGARCRCLRQ